MADGRVTQLAIEVLSQQPTPAVRVTQAVVEVLGTPAAVVTVARVTQVAVEVLGAGVASVGPAERVEVLLWMPV